MGSGKSAVGSCLARRARCDHFDTDSLVEEAAGQSVADIFQTQGETAFRDLETNALRNISGGHVVVSTGGGIVLRKENWPLMRRIGEIVWLDADMATLTARLGKSRRFRPAISGDDWIEVLTKMANDRRHLYERADYRIPVTEKGRPEQVARTILKETGWN
jgi:shikimate kinase